MRRAAGRQGVTGGCSAHGQGNGCPARHQSTVGIEFRQDQWRRGGVDVLTQLQVPITVAVSLRFAKQHAAAFKINIDDGIGRRFAGQQGAQ